MIAMKKLKRGFAASLALATVFTGAGMSAPADSGIVTAAHAANSGSVSLSHTILTSEARSANRLLTNSSVRITARAQITEASSDSSVVFTLPKGLQADTIPAHCGDDSSLSNKDEPSRHTATNASTWKSFKEQTLVCDLGDTKAGYNNPSVWIEAKVRPELPPNHKFEVDASIRSGSTTLGSTSYDKMPTVYSDAEIALGPHMSLHPDSKWPYTNYQSSWRAQTSNAEKHPHPDTEAASYWRINMGLILTAPSQYGNQPLDWSKSELSFDMDPNKVYFDGVTNTKAWKDRQSKHGDAYLYYMPYLKVSTTRTSASTTLGSGEDPLEAFRGNSNDLAFKPDVRNQKLTLDGTQIDTSAWTVPIRSAGGDNEPLPNKDGAYKGPNYEMLWARNFEVFTPAQAIADLLPYSPRSDKRLPVTISEPTFKGVGLHESNSPWTRASDWEKTGLGRADGHVEARHYITAAWKSSPLNTPGIVFSPGFSSWWEGLPGSSSTGDGEGELQYGETMMWASSNRITAPPGGAAAQFQCVSWDYTLSLKDPGTEFNPGSGSSQQSQRYPSKGPVYVSGGDATEGAKFQVQYSDARPAVSGPVDCGAYDNYGKNKAKWYSTPGAVPGNDASKTGDGVYTNVRSVRFVIASDVPVRRDFMVQVPLTPTTSWLSRDGDEAWVYGSHSSNNYRSTTFDSLSDISMNEFFADPDYDRMGTWERTSKGNRAEKVILGSSMSMVEVDVQSQVKGGELGRVTVKPYSRSEGPLDVEVKFDDKMTYHATAKGPKPYRVNSDSVIYRFSDPSKATDIAIDMLTTPQDVNVNGKITVTSRVPGETSRRNNNATGTMSIETSTPTAASLTANQDVVDVHPFTSPSQTNSWRMSFTNSAPYHQAEVTAYILMPRKGLTGNTLSHADADLITGKPTGTGWGVRGTTTEFNRNAIPKQLAAASYSTLPSDPSNVEVVRLTKTIEPGGTDTATLPMLTQATSDGDKITPHMIYEVNLKVDGRDALTFNGVTSPKTTEVEAGMTSGIAWIDGTVEDHDGVMQSSGRQSVPNMPVQVTGTTATGININKSVHGDSTKTRSDGTWWVNNLPAGSYKVAFADKGWMDSSDFTSFTKLGGGSSVGYSGSWTSNFTASNHRTVASVSVPGVSASNRKATANAGVIGDSGLVVTREKSHDYGYRNQGYVTSFKVTNSSDTFVEDVEVYDRLDPANVVGRSVARVTSGPGAVSNYGSSTTYTVAKLNPGQSATVQVTHKLSADKPKEGDKLPSTTKSEGFFYGYDSKVTEASTHTGEIAVPVISSDLSWTDSGSWLPSITDSRTGWQKGASAPSNAALVEPRDGIRIADSKAKDMFGPGESLASRYTLTNESKVVPVSVRTLLASLTGIELDEDVSFGARTLQPGASTTIDANFVDKMAQIEVDRNDAEADLDITAIAPRYKNNFSTETHNLDDEVTSAFDWDAWTVPFHRYSDLVLQGDARDASGDGVIEANEEGQFSYTWANKGNLTLTNPEFLDERTNSQPRFEGGFDGELAPGEQVRGETAMSVGASLFSDGLFSNAAWSTASAPLSSDEDPEARTTTMLTQRSDSGLDLTIKLVDANGDGSVSLGEKFNFDLVLRNNSSERYSEVEMSGPVKVTSGNKTYTLNVTFPSTFDGTMRPGDTVSPVTQSVTATETTTAKGYVDLTSGLLSAQARAVGVDTTGSSSVSNWATDTASVFSQPLVVSAGDGAGAVSQDADSSTTLYWVLGGIAALMILALILLLTPARRILSVKRIEDKEQASV